MYLKFTLFHQNMQNILGHNTEVDADPSGRTV
jgi:hypothetical protein